MVDHGAILAISPDGALMELSAVRRACPAYLIFFGMPALLDTTVQLRFNTPYLVLLVLTALLQDRMLCLIVFLLLLVTTRLVQQQSQRTCVTLATTVHCAPLVRTRYHVQSELIYPNMVAPQCQTAPSVLLVGTAQRVRRILWSARKETTVLLG